MTASLCPMHSHWHTRACLPLVLSSAHDKTLGYSYCQKPISYKMPPQMKHVREFEVVNIKGFCIMSYKSQMAWELSFCLTKKNSVHNRLYYRISFFFICTKIVIVSHAHIADKTNYTEVINIPASFSATYYASGAICSLWRPVLLK